MEMLSSAPSSSVREGALTLDRLGIDVRLGFLRKTYLMFMVGLLIAGAGAGAGMTVLEGVFSGLHPFAILIGFLVAQFATVAVARIPGVNVAAFSAFTFLEGLLISRLLIATLAIKGVHVGGLNIATALVGTMIGFGGLTAYVFISRKDFSFLGGFMVFAFLGMLGFAIFGIFMGMSPGMWIAYNAIGLLLAGAYVLYTTSNILHHYSERDWVLAALALFLDFVMMFIYLLNLLNSRRN
jgi:modulator of FtsH protease